ncbi:hypothetical protein MTR67_048615 [Solanum verrucosum]|uniref:Uncharacterized protein n=1 Tax=Solanum verrucosum TaxID=315347 RepID=A0AAF0UZX4_SOLVR|nr:hypothetical protein MTR67_048615 [Solanum verrucosum]
MHVLVKQAIMPRVHGLALKTTVAAVRVNALLCLGDMVHTLDKPAVLEILQTIQCCTAVDRSAPTLMCTLGVANSILKKNGIEFVAEHVLPLLMPLLIAQQLNVQQFAKYMAFVKEILRRTPTMEDFSDFIEDMELMVDFQLVVVVCDYTWIKGDRTNAASRIDRILVSKEWDDSFRKIK